MGIRSCRWGVGIATGGLFLVHAAVLAATGFVGVLEDLPLMPGLHEVAESDMVFETPSGRIVQVVASGSVEPQDVLRFYEETLPQLGWCHTDKGVFHRERERLVLEVGDRSGSSVTVRFTLAPAPGAGCR